MNDVLDQDLPAKFDMWYDLPVDSGGANNLRPRSPVVG